MVGEGFDGVVKYGLKGHVFDFWWMLTIPMV